MLEIRLYDTYLSTTYIRWYGYDNVIEETPIKPVYSMNPVFWLLAELTSFITCMEMKNHTDRQLCIDWR